MSLYNYMQIDMDRIIEESQEVIDRKSHPFHLSAEKVARFKGDCERLKRKNALVLESFMDQFHEYSESVHVKQLKKK